MIDCFHVRGCEDSCFIDVAEESNLPLGSRFQWGLAPSNDNIWLDPNSAKLLYTVLGRLGLLLSHDIQDWDEGDVNVRHVRAPLFQSKFARGFEIWKRFDVANRSSDFHNSQIGRVLPGDAP